MITETIQRRPIITIPIFVTTGTPIAPSWSPRPEQRMRPRLLWLRPRKSVTRIRSTRPASGNASRFSVRARIRSIAQSSSGSGTGWGRYAKRSPVILPACRKRDMLTASSSATWMGRQVAESPPGSATVLRRSNNAYPRTRFCARGRSRQPRKSCNRPSSNSNQSRIPIWPMTPGSAGASS